MHLHPQTQGKNEARGRGQGVRGNNKNRWRRGKGVGYGQGENTGQGSPRVKGGNNEGMGGDLVRIVLASGVSTFFILVSIYVKLFLTLTYKGYP